MNSRQAGDRWQSFTPVPPSYKAYLGLGRFRNALILEEAGRNPTEGLTNFIAPTGCRRTGPEEAGPEARAASAALSP